MTQLISPDMTIGDVVAKFPQVVDTMLKYGLHCVGCHVNAFETLEQGAMAHGMPEETFKRLIGDINEVATKPIEEIKEVVVLTKSAQEKVKALRLKQGDETFNFRIEVVPSGCSGLSYNFFFDDKVGAEDEVIEYDGLKVLVDKESVPFLKGSTVDFVDSLQGSGLKVNNPNSSGGCGCGSSFSV